MSDNQAFLQPKEVEIENFLLKKTFLEHLNYIYHGKLHLIDFFNEAKQIASLNVLKHAIQQGIDDTYSQMVQMGDVFEYINENPSKTNTLGIKAMTLEAYITGIRAGKTPLERDVSILFYLQQIEGIEITYFNVLKNLAGSVGYSHVYLDRSYDLAVENKILFESIYQEYIS